MLDRQVTPWGEAHSRRPAPSSRPFVASMPRAIRRVRRSETGTLARPNLLKIDDVLIRFGSLAGLAWIFGSLLALALTLNEAIDAAQSTMAVVLGASAPLGLLVAGFKIRRRERRAWALHRLVDDHVEISVSDLLRDSDFTAASLERAIRDLNNAGAAFLVWDRKADVVQDGRLRSTRVEVEDCGSCGAKVSLTLRVGDIASTRCPYCHDLLGTDRHMEEKAQLIDELDTDPAVVSARNRGESDFSIPIFAILTLLFWPLGIGYAFWKWQSGQLQF